MKKIWDLVTVTFLILLLAGIAVLYVPQWFGIEPMIVLSGSMEPTYPVGSLLYVKQIQTDSIKKGDVITFLLDGQTPVTHRVVEVDKKTRTCTTKGDANNTVDGSPVAFEQVIGTPAFHVKKAGYLADKISRPAGKIGYIAAIVVDLILMVMGDLIWPESKKEGRKHEKTPKHAA